MTALAEMLRPAEAAVVSGVMLRDVHHAIDRGILPDDLVRQGEVRGVSAAGCPLIAFYYASARRLTAEERVTAIREVSRRLRGAADERLWIRPVDGWIVREGFLQIDFEPFVAGTAERWERYRRALSLVSTSPDILSGTPVIAGTRIPVHDVAAALAAGQSMERVLSAYPSLTEEQADLAALYARANPLQGRPRARPILEAGHLVFEERIPRRKSE